MVSLAGAGGLVVVTRLPAASAAQPVVTAYVANAGSSTMTPIVAATNTGGKAIKAGSHPDAIAITPDGSTVYVADNNGARVTPVATATNTTGKAIRVGSYPTALAITPDGKTVYVASSGGGTVTPIATATNT